jgi:hypothetical protein
MKKVMGLAAAGLLAAGVANAGSLTVANSDITLYGGVSAGYQYLTTEHSAGGLSNNDYFSVNNFIVGLKKDADANSPIGFNAAFGNFAVPTVIASSSTINSNNLIAYGKTTSFMPWLAYVTIAPVQGLSVDAGLLWNKFGEAPITILNSNINRGILFTGHPVLFPGARVNYDAGVAKVYVGYNQGGGLLQAGVSDAIEAGVMSDLGAAKVGLHVYDEASGRNIYVLCVKSDLGVAKVGLEVDYTTLDTAPAGADDSAYGVALNLDPAVSNTVSVPIRIEYIDNKNSGIYLTGKDNAMSLTVTPTYKPTGNTFVRAEIAYTSTDAKVFVDDSGSAKDNRTYLGFEAGFLF